MSIERILVVDDSPEIIRYLKYAIPDSFKGEYDSARSVEEMRHKKPADLYAIDGLEGAWPEAVNIALKQNPDARIILVSLNPDYHNGHIGKSEYGKSGLRFLDKGDLPRILEEELKQA